MAGPASRNDLLENPSPLRAVALGSLLPQSLRGASQATALSTVSDLRLQSPFGGGSDRFESTLASLYKHGNSLAEAGQEALSVLKTLGHLPPSAISPSKSGYPKISR